MFEPRRIVHINTHDVAGGAAKVASRLAEAQRSMGFEAEMLVGYRRGREPHATAFARRPDPRLMGRCRESGWLDYEFQGSHRLNEQPLVQKADVLHLHNLHGEYFNPFSLAGLSIHRPAVWTLHDMQALTGHCAHAFSCPKWRNDCNGCPALKAEPAIAKDTAADLLAHKAAIYRHALFWVVTPSRWLGDKVAASILRDHPLEVIPNGIDTTLFKPADRRRARERFGIPNDRFVVGSVSNGGPLANPWKGGRFTLGAMAGFWQQHPDAVFVNIGGTAGDDDPRIISVPAITDERQLAEVYSALDVFLYTPIADNCPLVVIEALACGLPLVTFGVGGIPELVQDGGTGMVVTFEDVAGLVQALTAMAINPSRCSAMGNEARRYAVENLDHRQVAARYVDLYHTAVRDHGDRRLQATPLPMVQVPEMIQTPSFLSLHQTAWPGQKTFTEASRPPSFPKGERRPAGDPMQISIVTPSFNQGRYLEACIDSVLSQGYPRIEYVVMDGGSTDGSTEIIKKYEKHLTHWQSRPDGGQYAAIAEGFAKTHGPIMAWINSDDRLHPGALDIVGRIFSDRSDVHWITGRPNTIDTHGRSLWTMPTLPLWHRGKYLKKQYHHPYIQQEGTFFRRALWEKAGGRFHPQLNLAGDLEMWMRFFRHAPLHSVDALLGAFRQHDGQKTHTLLAAYNREAETVLDEEIRRWEQQGSLRPASAPLPITQMEIEALNPVAAKGGETESPAAEFNAVRGCGEDGSVLLSAIVSTYSAERFLPGCLDTLLAQTIADRMEIIVVDSASPQNERAVVDRYRERYPRIRYLRTKKRENVYAAWNRGIAMARGTYLVNANTDDRLRPDAYEKMARVLDQVPDAGAVYADSLITAGENETFDDHSAVRLFARPGFSLRQLLAFNCFGPHPMWRRSVHESVGVYDDRYEVAGDYDFFLRVASVHGAVHLKEVLGLYQERPGSIEHKRRRQCTQEVRRILRRHRSEIPLEKTYPGIGDDPAALSEAFTDLGNICLHGDLPNLEEAAAFYRRAVETGAPSAATLANLGVALAVVGQVEEGARLLEKGAADHDSAAANLERLRAHGERQGDEPLSERDFVPVDVTHPAVLAARRARRVVVSGQNVTAIPATETLWQGMEMIRTVSWARGGGGPTKAGAERPETPPVVSVVIPTHDRPEMLTAAVRSVLGQTYPHFEIVVVDDAGGVELKARMAAFADPRIRLLRHEVNRGIAAARNTGIRAARGRYIALLDDDDLFYPDHLATAVASLVAGHAVIYTEASRARLVAGRDGYRVVEKRVPYAIDFDRDSLLVGNISPVNCFVFDRTLALEAGLFDTSFTTLEDWEFWIRLSRKADFHHVARTTVQVNWRTDGTTLTSSRAMDFRRNRMRLNARHEDALAAIPDKSRILRRFEAIWKADGAGLQPMTSIVVLAYNQLAMTRRCIESVLAHTRSPFELIVVDNGSTDETVTYAKDLALVPSAATAVRVIANADNLGYAAGNNQGLAAARGDYLLLLNNDTVVTPGWLERLVGLARRSPDIGIVGPLSNQVAGAQMLEQVGYDTETLDGLEAFGEQLAVQGWKPRKAGRVVGFCMLFKREVLLRIGGLDQRFGTGNFEDDDYCLRAALAGYQSWIARDSFVHHAGGATFAAEGDQRHARLMENWRIFKKKWGLAADLPYGTYGIGGLLQRDFDPISDVEPLPAMKREAPTSPETAQKMQNTVRKTPATTGHGFGEGPEALQRQADTGHRMAAEAADIPRQQPVGRVWQKLPVTGKDCPKEEQPMTVQPLAADANKALRQIAPLMANERFDAALSALEPLADQHPDSPDVHAELGRVHHFLGESALAASHLERAAALAPERVDLKRTLADFYHVSQGRAEEALAIYESLAEAHPADAEIGLMAGHLNVGLQRLERARDYYQRVLENHPGHEEAARFLGAVEARSKALGEDAPGDDHARARELAEAGRMDEAMAMLETLVARQPDCAVFHNDLGVICFQKGQMDRALSHYRRAADLAPQEITFQKNLADFFYVQQGDVAEALRIFVRILDQHPDDVETLMTTGHICVSQHRFDDAAHFYTRVLEVEPWHGEARRFLDAVEKRRGEDAVASPAPDPSSPAGPSVSSEPAGDAVSLQTVLKENPNDAAAHSRLGELLHEAGDVEAARYHLESAASLAPDDFQIQKQMADFTYVALGRAEEALALYNALAKTHPEKTEILMLAGHLAVGLGRLDEAEDKYRRVMRVEPWHADAGRYLEALERHRSQAPESAASDPGEFHQKAVEKADAGDLAGAIIDLENLTAAHSDHALAHNDLGVLYSRQEKWDQAVFRYQRAVSLEPANPVFRKNLADCYAGTRHFQEALEIYVNLLAEDPFDVEALLATGQICMVLEQSDNARHFIDRALEAEPWNSQARDLLQALTATSTATESIDMEKTYDKALKQADAGDIQGAMGALRQVAAADPDHAPAHNDLGVLSYRAGDNPAAETHYLRAVELDPANSVYRKNLADFYCLALGRVEDALGIYVNLLAQDPYDVEVLLATGQICMALDQPENAAHFFQRALEAEPWNAQARQLLDQVDNLSHRTTPIEAS